MKMGMRWKLVTILAVATGLTLTILFSFYYKMLIDLPAFTGLAVATIFAGLLSAFVVYSFTRPIISDIESLAQAAHEVAGGNFDVHIAVRSRDELATLAEAFNAMATEVRTLFDQQRRNEQARQNLVANVSHDLRTPLTATASMLQALDDGIIDDEATMRRYLRTMAQEISYMNGLIRNLSDLSRLESGQVQLDPQSVHIEDLVTEVLETFGVSAEQRRITFQVDIAGDIPTIWADGTRLRQAVTNVLQNALSHAPVRSRILVAVSFLEKKLRLSVIDEGPGIPPRARSDIFERFYRADPARSRQNTHGGGMGLGLAIAKDIVEMHGGRIGLDEQRRNGAKIWIELPCTTP